MSRPWRAALIGFAINAVWFSVFMSFTSEAGVLRIAVLAIALGLMMGTVNYRMATGRPALPTAVMVLSGLGALALYVYGVLVSERPESVGEWVAVPFVFAIPIAILFMAYRQWQRERAHQ